MKRIFKITSVVSGMMFLLLAAFGVMAQDQDTYSATDESLNRLAMSEAAAASAPADIDQANIVPFSCGVANCAYLPLVETPPTLNRGTAFHKTDCSASESATAVANGGIVTLGGGQRSLAFGARAEGYRGASYNTYFVIDGQEFQNFDTSGTITSDSQDIFSTTLSFGTGFGCQNPLPTGTYTVRFFIEGKLITELSAAVN